VFKRLNPRVYVIGDDQNQVQVRVFCMNRRTKKREGGFDVGRKGEEEKEVRKGQKQKATRRRYVRVTIAVVTGQEREKRGKSNGKQLGNAGDLKCRPAMLLCKANASAREVLQTADLHLKMLST
jgi:hypothetical protein